MVISPLRPSFAQAFLSRVDGGIEALILSLVAA
jgi:hypothetical protein